MLAEGQEVIEFENRYVRDGSLRWCTDERSAEPLHGD